MFLKTSTLSKMVAGRTLAARVASFSVWNFVLATGFVCLVTWRTEAAEQVRVTIQNNAPSGGVFITPVWVGFHDGSFDSYDGGLSSQPGLERLAEDGDSSQLSSDFGNGLTYIDTSGGPPVSATVASSQPGAERVQGGVGGGPLGPGATAFQDFLIDPSGINRYFSYASMVLPTSDYYVANGGPTAHDLQVLDGAPVGTTVSFNIGLPGGVNDAGTEVNDFDTSAGNPLISGLPAGQGGPNQGADENGVNLNVVSAFAGFLNTPAGFLAANPNLDFNDNGLYPNGIASVTISVIPEPSGWILAGIGLVGVILRHRKQRTAG